jgi:hypothetical protein
MGKPRRDDEAELKEEICKKISLGQTLSKICDGKADSGKPMPFRDCVYKWLESDDDFKTRYQQARVLQMESWADEILDIADNKDSDRYCDEYGNEKPNYEHINRSKLRIDTRKFLMAKIAPRLQHWYKNGSSFIPDYNDKSAATGGDEEQPTPGFNISLDTDA